MEYEICNQCYDRYEYKDIKYNGQLVRFFYDEIKCNFTEENKIGFAKYMIGTHRLTDMLRNCGVKYKLFNDKLCIFCNFHSYFVSEEEDIRLAILKDLHNIAKIEMDKDLEDAYQKFT